MWIPRIHIAQDRNKQLFCQKFLTELETQWLLIPVRAPSPLRSTLIGAVVYGHLIILCLLFELHSRADGPNLLLFPLEIECIVNIYALRGMDHVVIHPAAICMRRRRSCRVDSIHHHLLLLCVCCLCVVCLLSVRCVSAVCLLCVCACRDGLWFLHFNKG